MLAVPATKLRRGPLARRGTPALAAAFSATLSLMLRTWPASSTSLPLLKYSTVAGLGLLLACSSAGVPEGETDTLPGSSSGGGGSTSNVIHDDTAHTGTFTASTVTESPPTTGGDVSTGFTSSITDTTAANPSTGNDTTGIHGTSTGTGTGTGTEGSSSTGEPLPGCADKILNQDETDVDCGGSCPACGDGLACIDDPDCTSIVCTDGVCQAPTCDDGKKNAMETDIDYDGSCPIPCGDGEGCLDPSDCESEVCTGDLCQPAACDDTVLNGDETAIDCGGPECDGCEDGALCILADDCLSGVCVDDHCAAPTCEDKTKNGEETDVDCGGPDCQACKLPTLILNEVDYDQIGTDAAEFIEILNITGAPVNLTGLQVILVNGGVNPAKFYTTINLGNGVLDNGKYMLVAPAGFPAPPGTAVVNFAQLTNQIQNGDPDGVALVDSVNKVVLDVLSYGGAITMADLGVALGTKSLVEGQALPANVKDSNANPGSLARLPDGTDQNNASTDWAFSKTPTPGAANAP